MFASAICDIFGQHSMTISNPDHITGNFNAHLQDTCLLFADEVLWQGLKKSEGILKALITGSSLTVERKGFDTIEVPNYLHIIMASNEDRIVPATVGERRFAVFELSSKYQQNLKYFSALMEEIENGGLEALLHYLMAVDITDWHPRDMVPQTTALQEQKISSLTDIQRVLFDCLANGELPYHKKVGDYYLLSTVEFRTFVNENSRYKNYTDHAVAAFLGKQITNPDGSFRQNKCMGFQKEDKSSPKGFLIPELSEARSMWDNDAVAWHQQHTKEQHF